ncbi:hypothetical protein [Streptomyces sp. MBT27]|uniref:hypothetical protein n=1 Tax=Streptomyces sp. MBT27 TaxID=1488356 RepID=UPI0018776237|nr:hypothetical protein [Streptomyces sp. MBT27]
MPVLVTTLEQLQEHGVGAAAAGRTGEQMLAAAFDTLDGDALDREAACTDAHEQRRRPGPRRRAWMTGS